MSTWEVYIDGASRNNPGLAGAGIYVLKNGEPFLKKCSFLGVKTNNQAEYYALLLGLFYVHLLIASGDQVSIFSDSQLMVRQLKGEYRVKDSDLRPLYMCAATFLATIIWKIEHIVRAKNAMADRLANEGIDKKLPLPRGFGVFCKQYYNQ